MTYEELANEIAKMTPEQKKQKVQIYQDPNTPEVAALKPAICFDTLKNLEVPKARSCYDNKFHGEDFVLMIDHNFFASDGCTAYELKTNKDGKYDFIPRDYPFGKTTEEDQTNPELKVIYENDIANYQYKILEGRLKDADN